MEANQLPTKPGPYYWRESDGDEWELWHVDENVNQPGLTARRGFNVARPEKLGGQWLPIPTAEELVELQAKAKMVDDGIEDAYVVTSVSGRSVSIDFTEPRAWSLAERLEGIFRCDLESSGYTCRKWSSIPRRSEVLELLDLVDRIQTEPVGVYADWAKSWDNLRQYADKLRKEIGE